MTDPTTRYYAETPCPWCGGIGERSDISIEVGYSVECGSCHGSGLFSRTLLTVREVDLDAAWQSKTARRYGLTKGAVHDVLDAALGGSVVLVEEGE